MEIKFIATDVDGTLVMDDHMTIPQVNIDAIKQAKIEGIITAISTGRTNVATIEASKALGGVDYLILSNGAVIMDGRTNEIIYSNYFPTDTIEKVISIIEKYPIIYEIYADGKGYVNQYTNDNYFDIKALPYDFLVEYIKILETTDDVLELVRSHNVEKININQVPKEYIESVTAELKDIPSLVFSAGFDGNMEIVVKGSDKGSAIKRIVDKLNIQPESIMAFGDSLNDATMLKYAGVSYALLSGNDAAKNAAKNITKVGNNEGGVGLAIKEYLTNSPK